MRLKGGKKKKTHFGVNLAANTKSFVILAPDDYKLNQVYV